MAENYLSRFADATEREAYSIIASERGHLFLQLDDNSLWRALAIGTGASNWERVSDSSKVAFTMPDPAALDGTATTYVVAPVAGDVVAIYSVIGGALTGGDPTLTFDIDGTAITGGVITIANASSAAGDIDSCTPSSANTVTTGGASYIGCTVAANSQTNVITAAVTIVMQQYT